MPQPQIDYTARDFNSNLAALQDYVRQAAPDSWNSLFAGDLGEVLLEAIAYDASMLSYLIDAQAQESFIDTLVHRESLLHFVRLVGYQLRRSTSASVEVYAEAANAPVYPDEIVIAAGTQVRSSGGLMWGVARTARILPGRRTPVEVASSYGDITARNLDAGGQAVAVKALVKLQPGLSYAVLSDAAGLRFNSQFAFGATVSEGHVLRLGAQSVAGTFGAVPSPPLDEYAIVGVGKLPDDANDRSVLYLDRAWSGTTAWVGKWSVENRNITMVQGQVRVESFTAPIAPEERAGWEARASFYPVTGGSAEAFIAAGSSFGDSTSAGVDVTVNGILWRETPSLLFEPADALAYQTRFDELDRLTVVFGDGVFGALLPSAAGVVVSYRTGGGSAGNIAQGEFNTTIRAGSGTVFLSNDYTTGKGGQDRESTRSAKRNIPLHVRANDRGVTVEDYAYLASNFVDRRTGRIKLARGVLHRNAVPRENNVVWVYAWAEGVGGRLAPPSLALKRALQEYMDRRSMVTDEVVVVDGKVTHLPFRVRYRYALDADEATMEERVAAAVASYFTSLLPGCPYRSADVSRAISAVPGVETVSVSPSGDVMPSGEHELFVNDVQHPFLPTTLSSPTSLGATSLPVADAAGISAGGTVSVWQDGRLASAAEVVSVASSVVSVRPDQPMADRYGTGAVVLGSDYYPISWQLENRVDIFVEFREPSEAVAANIVRRIREHFEEVLLPERDLVRADLEAVVSSTTGVVEFSVFIGSLGSEVERVEASSREKVVIRTLTVNGEVRVASSSRC